MDEKTLPVISTRSTLHQRPSSSQWLARLWNPRRNHVRSLFGMSLLAIIWLQYWGSRGACLSDIIISTNGFKQTRMIGYVNMGATEKHACDEICYEGQIGVQQSFDIHDDILAIANELDDHPMIDYSGQNKSLSHEEIVEKTWLRMAQSSVWLEKYHVYLTVTRVLFYDKGVRNWPVISFIRGQIHDKKWRELTGYVLHWQNRQIVFPLIFDIPSPFGIGGGFYGPEDPRVIIEHDQPDAEPVIIFNMISNIETLRRSMYIYRPFSDTTTVLAIRGLPPNQVEKNWMPFFYNSQDDESRVAGPNRYIHFVYNFNPLSILKCRLQYGWCDLVYYQEIPAEHKTTHNDSGGVLRGGSNFHAVTLANGKQSFVGFPRTHINPTCADGYYRPEVAVLSAISDKLFHMDYLSHPLDFDDAAVDPSKVKDTCVEGRILIVNSISKWDRTLLDDTMTISVTVDDYTTQVMRLRGVWPLLKSLPRVTEPRELIGAMKSNLPWAVPSQDVVGCCIESAVQYANAAYEKSGQYERNELAKKEESARLERLAKQEELMKLEESMKVEAAKAEEQRKKAEEEKGTGT